ncbi:MAG: Xaa-Pro peptidase family protein [Planctomycetota bacterium]|nr:Xaa-Pro peptidase family protein [Planctomycetota bacterium]MDA1140739.1 Xaa-Pro peptidase family protein [Planctomycetota bacterium]
MLTTEGCLQRQKRLREKLTGQDIDAAIITHYLEIYYFTGVLLNEAHPGCLYLETSGSTWLVAASNVDSECLDDCIVYDWAIGFTAHQDLTRRACENVSARLQSAGKAGRIGYQAEFMPKMFADTVENVFGKCEWVALDETLLDLQKRKDPDEIAVIRKAIQADLAAYDAAQRTIAPGVNELEVLAAAREAACLAAGEKVFHDGDYQCGGFGGFARDRKIEAGEIYIIDAWCIYHGYWADLCRAFSVDGNPTDIQQSVYDHIKSFHEQLPDYLQPGKDGSDCWKAIDAHIREHPALADAGLIHHAGHNVGLRAHQLPDLNEKRGGTFEIGNVVSVEPGAYIPEMRAGVRLENMYLITENGLENLSEYPFEIQCKK